jgi:hypothetical protein
MHTEWSKKASAPAITFVYFNMRLSLLAQAWGGYEDIKYEELYIGDYDNDK